MPYTTIYKFGDIVFVGFPHTDFQGVSKRPAVVLYDSGGHDVLVARITQQEHTSEADYKISEWENAVFTGHHTSG